MFTQMYVPNNADNWKNAVRNDAEKAWKESENCVPRPFTGPLCVNLEFYFQRPQTHFNSKGVLKSNAPTWAEVSKDRDNLDKVILDALTNICIWRDDRQVCAGYILKRYGNSRTGCQIEIKELDNTPTEAMQPTFELTLERTI
jgi:Holliday junction resolvase RusA-like endonuclease